jgi:mRNA interferase MazF
MESQKYNHSRQEGRIKKNSSHSESSQQPKQGEIWLIDYTFNFTQLKSKEFEVESQLKKLRPSVILSNNIQNKFSDRIIVAPLTSKSIEVINSPFEVLIKVDKNNSLEKDSKILLQFLLSIDKNSRLIKRLGKINETESKEVHKGIEVIFRRI